MSFRFSVIIPVYNRPQEVEELLESLTSQTFTNFEVLIVEDGSQDTCEKVFERFTGKLHIQYFFKPNSGPGPSRNFGFQQAKGDYLVMFDSDCILPPNYFSSVEAFLANDQLDAWGGPDMGHSSFTAVQQAMAFTMSSVITTGGIRGGENQIGKFQPRSFNMGISKEVFTRTGGFKFDRFAEDIEFGFRIRKAGFKIGYIGEAFVYHKRRTNLKQFFWQVFNFGRGRVLVSRAHRGAIKITHWFPLFFTLGLPTGLSLVVVNVGLGSVVLVLYILYLLLIMASSLKATRSLKVALLVGPAVLVQLVGYGLGFLKELLKF